VVWIEHADTHQSLGNKKVAGCRVHVVLGTLDRVTRLVAYRIPSTPRSASWSTFTRNLGGKIKANRQEGERLAADMKHVEARHSYVRSSL